MIFFNDTNPMPTRLLVSGAVNGAESSKGGDRLALLSKIFLRLAWIISHEKCDGKKIAVASYVS